MLAWVAHQTHTNSATLRMKTEMVFEMSVSTKAEPHYPAENLKELLHENSLVHRENIKMHMLSGLLQEQR
jgi:hypothetical protein